jgi:hypothetical protein
LNIPLLRLGDVLLFLGARIGLRVGLFGTGWRLILVRIRSLSNQHWCILYLNSHKLLDKELKNLIPLLGVHLMNVLHFAYFERYFIFGDNLRLHNLLALL